MRHPQQRKMDRSSSFVTTLSRTRSIYSMRRLVLRGYGGGLEIPMCSSADLPMQVASAQPPKFEEPVIEKKAEDIVAQQVLRNSPCSHDAWLHMISHGALGRGSLTEGNSFHACAMDNRLMDSIVRQGVCVISAHPEQHWGNVAPPCRM